MWSLGPGGPNKRNSEESIGDEHGKCNGHRASIGSSIGIACEGLHS